LQITKQKKRRMRKRRRKKVTLVHRNSLAGKVRTWYLAA
jgi:hypothetical protein